MPSCRLSQSLSQLLIFGIIGFSCGSSLMAGPDQMHKIARKTNLKLQDTLDQQFSQNLDRIEYTMLSDMDRSMGPYHGIAHDVLINFIYRIIQRHEMEGPRS